MTLATGSRLGPYEILAPLGAGGMGEVYRARDTRLERTVAIKVLPTDLSTSPEIRQRFEREAKTISQLSHPHICALYDVGHQDGTDYLVMEYLEGETLADRLGRGTLSVEQTLRFGTEIADALGRAHRQGIVHRDLKPGNVMLTKSGVKLLDFGLAKAMQAPGAPSGLTSFPTMAGSPALTQEGTILGTYQYMAPEQLEGKESDARTDIFALGCVLYEMATGKKAFSGGSQASLIGAVLHSEPPAISTIVPTAPPTLERVVRRCLAKDPDDRWQSAQDVAAELRWIAAESSSSGIHPAPGLAPPPRRGRAWLPWAVAAIAVLAAGAWALFGARGTSGDTQVLRAALLPPKGMTGLGPISLSRDGRRVAFAATGADGNRVLCVRALDAAEPQILPGTEGALYPFWSPDGRSVGFFTATKMKRIDLAGGPPRDLANVSDPRGGTWSPEGVIVFGPNAGSALFRVAPGGGEATPVTRLDAGRQETSHRWPHFLPDGRRFVYMNRSPSPKDRLILEIGSIDGKERVRLVEADTSAVYARGRLFFLRGTTLTAQNFDAGSLRLSGEPAAVLDGVWRDPATDGMAAFSVSPDGTIAYRAGGFVANQLTWFDRQGRPQGTIGPVGSYASPSLSPDARLLATDSQEADLNTAWMIVLDTSVGSSRRLTFGNFNDTTAVWSPDGSRIAFSSDRKGPFDIYVKDASGASEAQPLVETPHWKYAESWSPDGGTLAFRQIDPKTRGDIWLLPMRGDRKPSPLIQTPADERNAAFSPDGRFIAYGSDESGREEVYVQAVPASGAKWQMSSGGGSAPAWRSDGKELFFVGVGRTVMAVPITRDGERLQPGPPRLLFTSPSPLITAQGRDFTVSPDGERFLICHSAIADVASPIVVAVNAPVP